MSGLYFEYEREAWWVGRAPSPNMSRLGHDDVMVCRRGSWGMRHPDGNLYRCCVRYAAESGAVLREFEWIPPIVTVEWLRDKGFIDPVQIV